MNNRPHSPRIQNRCRIYTIQLSLFLSGKDGYLDDSGLCIGNPSYNSCAFAFFPYFYSTLDGTHGNAIERLVTSKMTESPYSCHPYKRYIIFESSSILSSILNQFRQSHTILQTNSYDSDLTAGIYIAFIQVHFDTQFDSIRGYFCLEDSRVFSD